MVVLPWGGVSGAVMAAAFEPAFSDTDTRRLYVDLPGTGSSATVDATSDAVLDAVHETVDSLVRSEPFILAGCSYGGYLATGLVRRIPDRVERLLLVCSGVRIAVADRDVSGVLGLTSEAGWLADVPEGLHKHLTRAVGLQTKAVAGRIAQAFELNGPADEDFLTELRTTGYPLADEGSDRQFAGDMLMVAGRSDRVGGFRDQFRAMNRYPRGSYLAVAGVGHYLPFEAPALFTSLVQTWLASPL